MLNDTLLKIRKLAIIALFSDDDLMERFVLKGGNALNIAYGMKDRASIDIDVSMRDDFAPEEMGDIEERLKEALIKTFKREKYHVFDVNLKPQPGRPGKDTKSFWGGYRLEFKLIESEKFKEFEGNVEILRRNSLVTGIGQERIFKIDISKYEFCDSKQEIELDGYLIYVIRR